MSITSFKLILKIPLLSPTLKPVLDLHVNTCYHSAMDEKKSPPKTTYSITQVVSLKLKEIAIGLGYRSVSAMLRDIATGKLKIINEEKEKE